MKSYLKPGLALGLISGLAVLATMSDAKRPRKIAKKPTEELSAALKKVTQQNLDAMGKEDLDRYMSTVHAKSPVYGQTRRTIRQMFVAYDLQYKLLSLRYIGMDEEYAVVRVKQKTTKIRGPAFRDNIIDVMQIFRKEGKRWKIWQSAVLEVRYLPVPAPRAGQTRPAVPGW